jgi:hypothetical protein
MPDAALTPRPRPVRRLRPVAALAAAGALAVGAAACSPTSSESDTTSTTAATSTTAPTGGSTPASAGGSSYGSIAELHEAIVGADFACTLEYPGLEDDVSNSEVSICTIEGEQAFLTIWRDPADVADFVESPEGATGTVAIGGDWTISVSSEDLAGRLADALGGSAPSAG